MNSRVNLKAKPSIVLEGHVDSTLTAIEETRKSESENGIKQIVYAGSVNELYGIKNLVEGFILAGVEKSELCVYGDGDFSNKLREFSKSYDNIRVFGVKENSEVVEAEQKAALLVNPRPSTPEYTKYSFPSKNMEYMVSGTPVLTTRLPGMPEEYYPFVYLISDETPLGISDSLRKILNISKDERDKKGEEARAFVLSKKSNVKQAEKIISFLREEVKNG